MLVAMSAAVHAVDVLNVHIIGHSHCDPGWLTTFEVRCAAQTSCVRIVSGRVVSCC